MNDLIERIDSMLMPFRYAVTPQVRTLLLDCRAEIERLTLALKDSRAIGLRLAQDRETTDAENERLLTANESLKGLCEEYQAQIKAQGEYVPMTDDELFKLHTSKSAVSRELMYDSRWVEAEVIKRAGLRAKDTP